jgi:hypothetical protein
MQTVDYSIFYKEKYEDIYSFENQNNWDLFISSYSESERVQTVFQKANAKEKHWLLLPEYNYSEKDISIKSDYNFLYSNNSESEFIIKYIDSIDIDSFRDEICVDITGFIRPYLIFLLRYLFEQNIKKLQVVYSFPQSYSRQELTRFTDNNVLEIRQVDGCSGIHSSDSSFDLLIIGAGYDYELINNIANHKSNAKKIQLFGFPSFHPDMFQENIIRAHLSEESIGGHEFRIDYFAPAHDPFITANVLQEIVMQQNQSKKVTNLYLCPLSSKPQTLGFALYYIWEGINMPTSIVFPFCSQYERVSTVGLSKIWKYYIEFPDKVNIP